MEEEGCKLDAELKGKSAAGRRGGTSSAPRESTRLRVVEMLHLTSPTTTSARAYFL